MSRLGGMFAALLLLLHTPGLRAAEGVAKTYPIEKVMEVVYGKGGGVELKLDYARPKEAGVFPGILCIHGGGWAAGKRQDFQFLVERLAGQGYVAVTASYRFAPKDQFPAQIEDVKCAVRWMRAHAETLRLDPTRIGAIGASAGGHLACLLGSSDAGDHLEGGGGWPQASSRVQAVVNYFGPTDMTVGRFPDASYKILEGFLGGSLEDHRAEYRRASPVVYLTPDDPPVMTFQGTVDQLVPLEQAEILHRRLADLHILNRLVILEGRGHGWSGEDMERTVQDSIAFFDRCLKGRKVDRL